MVPTPEQHSRKKGEVISSPGATETSGALHETAAQKTSSSHLVASGGGLGHGHEHKQRATAFPVHLIYHVPKCAGRTIDRHLAASLSPNAYCRTTRRRGLGRFLSSRHDFQRIPNPNQTRAVCGHFIGVSVERLFAGRELKRSLLLRDPVSHIVSYYNFRMMRYLSRGLHPYSFSLAYRATQRNFITHYILRNFLELPWSRLARFSDDEKYDTVNAFLATFWFVGDYRLCDDLIAALGATLAIPGCAAAINTCAEWQRRGRWMRLEADDLSADAVAQIRRENLLDQRLWETWREAGTDVASVRPRALAGRNATGFVTAEATRFVNQIARRIQRRWGPFKGLQVPTTEGRAGVPVLGAVGSAAGSRSVDYDVR